MVNRGFVFSTTGFLLVIPAVILAASFVHMLKTGSSATPLIIAADTVFFTYEDIKDDLCKVNTTNITYSQFMDYVENNLSIYVGLNISMKQTSNDTFQLEVWHPYSNVNKSGSIDLSIMCPSGAGEDNTGPSVGTPQESDDPICLDGTGSPTTVTINVSILDASSNVTSATIYYELPGGSWTTRAMDASDGAFDSSSEVAETTLGPCSSTGTISYWILANDTFGNEGQSEVNYSVQVQDCGTETVYYLHDDGSYDPDDPDDILSTGAPANPANTKYRPGKQDGMQIEEGYDSTDNRTFQRWESGSLNTTNISGDVTIYLWLKSKTANKKGTVNITLYEKSGATYTSIGNVTEDRGCTNWPNSYTEFTFTIPSVSSTITTGNSLVLMVNIPTSGVSCTSESDFYFHYDTDTYNSRVILPTG